MGAAYMQQGGQLELCREPELGFEQLLLALAVERLDEVVQAELADRTQPRVAGQALQPGAQFVQVLGAVLVEVDRMQAEGSVQAFVRLHQVPQALPVALIHAEYHQFLHPQTAAALQQPGAIGVELGEVEVSVGVDQVHGRSIGDLPALRQPWSGAFPAAAAFGCNKAPI